MAIAHNHTHPINQKLSFDSCKGKKRTSGEESEDHHLITTHGDWTFLAVADGFKKPTESGIQSGASVAKKVIRLLEEQLVAFPSEIEHNPASVFQQIFAHIDQQTAEEVAGSTLNLTAIHGRIVHTAILGDSLTVYQRKDHRLIIAPSAKIAECGEKLWGCFGDRENRQHHKQEPEIEISEMSAHSALIVSSDGLYPLTRALAHQVSSSLRKLALEYLQAAEKGYDASRLITLAQNYGAEDDITAILYRCYATDC